jgi:hypothetical protein
VDVVCLLLVLLAGVIALSGGFRIRIWGIRVAFTSPLRLLVWAAVLGVARHVAAPASPIYRDLPSRLLEAWRTEAIGTAWAALVATRLSVLFVGLLAIFMIGYPRNAPPYRLAENELVNLQVRWDTGWYLGIASDGYRYNPNRPQSQQNVVFFPAYPLLTRLAGRLVGGGAAGYVLGGSLLSWLAFFGGLVYLYRLAFDLLGREHVARASVWLLATFPFALFFGAVYTESLYLLGATGAFYHLRKGEWWKAGACGLLVGLTRPNGCFLSVSLALMAATPWLPSWVAGARTAPSADLPRSSVLPGLAAAAMPGLGVLLYSGYVWRLTGNPLAWAEGHFAWGRSYNGLGVLVSQRYEWLSQGGLYEYTANLPGDLINTLAVLFVLVAAVPAARRLGLAYAIFILMNILPPLAAGGLISAGRFSSVLFPAFIWLGSVVPERQQPAWFAGFAAVQAFNAALFYTWRPMF